jgi:putative FmdB family regulatory protein
MPVFDYKCRACSNKFEALVRGTKVPSCPKCASQDLDRLLSLPAVRSETTTALAMKAARRRDKGQASDADRAQREYEAHHDD